MAKIEPTLYPCVTYIKMSSPRSVVYKRVESAVPLIVHGQGVFLFDIAEAGRPCWFTCLDASGEKGLRVEFTETSVFVTNIQTKEAFVDPKCQPGLSPKAGAFYWFSIDAPNGCLRAGIGEARVETATYNYVFPAALHASNRAFLESIVTISIPVPTVSVRCLRMLRDPVTTRVPMLVQKTDHLTMLDIGKGTYLPHTHMSAVGQQMYGAISGRNFVLDDDDFPDFSKAIQHSIKTPGLWCNKKLRDKSTEFNPDKPCLLETYLRITLNQNNGESPGIPYVMEIWPSAHYSPIHSHAGASAVIRVLHGSIHAALYPFLSDQKGGGLSFGTERFDKGDITWISPALNQTHKLGNMEKDVCVTIQCYMYEEDDAKHYDYFDYIDSEGKKKQYEPDSDMDYVAFRALMKEEWEARVRPRFWCC